MQVPVLNRADRPYESQLDTCRTCIVIHLFGAARMGIEPISPAEVKYSAKHDIFEDSGQKKNSTQDESRFSHLIRDVMLLAQQHNLIDI